MNVQLWRSVCYNMKVNKYFSTSAKCFSKKQYRMKNKFNYSDDLKNVDLEKSKNKICSAELISSQNEYEKESYFTHGFVSADLLSNRDRQKRRENALPLKTKHRKPSLAYQGEILFGVHPVHLALLQKKRTFYHLYTRDDIDSTNEDSSKKTEILKLARTLNIPISFINSKGLRILAPDDAVHQGICLDAGFLPLPLWNEEQCNVAAFENKPLWLVLDEILDPMNVGAIIRSAYYFGINRLFTVRGNSCKLSPIVSKASSGALEVMDIYQIGNLEEFVMRRKDSGWSVVSTLAYSKNEEEMTKLVNIDKITTSNPTILILGNEGRGISENILKLCDSLISINPGQALHKGIDSLNVSVAAGVLLYVLSNSQNTR